jgi:hypothetical protein
LSASALLDNLKSYHDQLVLLGSKIRFGPEHCNVSFKWFCSYSPRGSDKEVYELCNIDWEFANVLFNIAILTYLKGKKESLNKNREEAKKCFQEAAGIILFLKDNQLKKINRRTNDLNDHALELIFNAFVGYVQLEVAKKACEGEFFQFLISILIFLKEKQMTSLSQVYMKARRDCSIRTI